MVYGISHKHQFHWIIVFLFFYCPNAVIGFEDKYYMRKGREKNECKKQQMYRKNDGAA